MSVASLSLQIAVEGVNGPQQVTEVVRRFAQATALANGQRSTVNLTASAFTAFTIPSGAKVAIIFLTTAGESLTLKGATGDGTGIAISPSSNPLGLPLVIPLGSSPSLGILNSGGADERVEVIFL